MTAATSQPLTRDAASYWLTGPPANDDAADDVDGILWTRRTASAYGRPTGALEHLKIAAAALVTAVNRMPDHPVAFQGHVLASGLLATWAVELAVHQMDLATDLEIGRPTRESLRLARITVEAPAGSALPADWSDEACLLLGTGRTPVDAATRAAAGPVADRLPVLG